MGNRENRRKMANIFPMFPLIYHSKGAVMHTVEEAPAMSGCLLFARNDTASAVVRQLVQTVFTSVWTMEALGI